MKRFSRIAGFGHYVPSRCVLNAELESQMGLSPGWIERRTGIRARHWAAPDEALTDLAVKAGAAALDQAGIARSEIALTLLATSTPDHLLPPSAPLLAYRLGLLNAGAVDLAGACSGFLYALNLADGFVKTQGKPVLVVAANILSRRINMAEPASAVVFSDAAGAIVLVPSANPDVGVLGADVASDGGYYDLISVPAGGSRRPFAQGMDSQALLMQMQDGAQVFVQAVHLMVQCANRALRAAGLTVEDVHHFVPHQANTRILYKVCKKIGLPPHRTVRTVEAFGNSSAATIPLSLSLAHAERLFSPGDRVLLTASGAGMTGAAIVLGMGEEV